MSTKSASALLVAILFSAPALWAQEDDELEGILDEAPASEGAEGSEEGAAPAEGAAARRYTRDDFPRLSDDEETIYAVQRKAFLIQNKIELTVMGSASFTDRFVQTFAPALSVTYHVRENFGLELFGSYLFPNESGLTDELGAEKLRPEVAKLTQMLWAVGLGAQWSPVYGKLELFGTSLGNFGFYLAAGAGLGQTRVQCLRQEIALDPNQFGPGQFCGPFENPDDPNPIVYEPNRLQFMASFAGGFRFYFSQLIGLKVEVRDWIFPTRVFVADPNVGGQDRYTDTIRNNVFIQVGVSFLFGGEDN